MPKLQRTIKDQGQARAKRLVFGLRDFDIPGEEVRVFSATTGELLRVEKPTTYKPYFNNRTIRSGNG